MNTCPICENDNERCQCEEKKEQRLGKTLAQHQEEKTSSLDVCTGCGQVLIFADTYAGILCDECQN